MKKLFLSALLAFCFLYAFYIPAYASFGISPAEITYEYLTPGFTYEKQFVISRTKEDEPINVVIESDVPGADKWFTFDPGLTFEIASGGDRKNMSVIINVPENQIKKSFEGYINLKFMPLGTPAGVSVVPGLGIKVNLGMTDKDYFKLKIRSFEISDVTAGEPVTFIFHAENEGNKPAKPDELNVKFVNSKDLEVNNYKYSDFQNLPAGSEGEFVSLIENNLEPGEYNTEFELSFRGTRLYKDNGIFRVNPMTTESEETVNNDYLKVFVYNILISIAPISIIWILLRKRFQKKQI